jgi:hypothetical protein
MRPLPQFLNPAVPAAPAAPGVPAAPATPAVPGAPGQQIDFMTWLGKIARGESYSGRRPKFDAAAQKAINARFARPQQIPGQVPGQVPGQIPGQPQQGMDFPLFRQLLGNFQIPQLPRS